MARGAGSGLWRASDWVSIVTDCHFANAGSSGCGLVLCDVLSCEVTGGYARGPKAYEDIGVIFISTDMVSITVEEPDA